MDVGDADALQIVAAQLKQSALEQGSQGYHYDMMHDLARNKKYRDALHADVQCDDFVLDIGAGSGLLSLLASRTVAQHVFACEADEMLADAARAVVDANAAEALVSIHRKRSTELIVGSGCDLPCRADLLVTEIFDSVLLGEGILPSLRDAQAEAAHAWRTRDPARRHHRCDPPGIDERGGHVRAEE